jgi:CDP-glucose 4,6-dehydratase
VSDFWDDRPVLVTGATGLLGAWLVEALVARRARVVMLVRDLVPDSRVHQSGASRHAVTAYGDVRDGRLVERLLAEYEIDTVFHLAAQTIVEHAYRDPANTLRSNVEGTWEVLDACRRSGRPRAIVVASSDKAYGPQPQLPYHEDHPLQGRHPYDVSKSCADLIAQSYAWSYDMPVVTTRCGNLFGGGDLNFNRIVPGTIRSALAGERPVLRSDGTPERDYLYAEDAVSAYLLAGRHAGDAGVRGLAFNFSAESPIDVLALTRMILAACGRHDLEPVVEAVAEHEIQAQFLSAERARRLLGWRPEHDLAESLARTVHWYRDHLAGELADAA